MRWIITSGGRPKPVLFIAGVAVIAGLLYLARAHAVLPGDEWALLELRQWRAGWLDLAIGVLYMAAFGAPSLPYLQIMLVIFVALGRWRDGLLLAASGVLPLLLNLGLKEWAARPRPDAALALVEETGYAFPSSHTVVAVAFYGALIYLLGQWDAFSGRPALRRAIQGALALLILAVGASRVYLGAHWPSDVIGGFLFGGLCLAALVAGHRMMQKGR